MQEITKNQALLALANKIKENPSLVNKFSEINDTNIDELYTVALSISDGYTKDEFLQFLKDIYNSANLDNVKSLDESKLDKVIGGSKLGKFLDDTCEFLDYGGSNIIYMLTNS